MIKLKTKRDRTSNNDPRSSSLKKKIILILALFQLPITLSLVIILAWVTSQISYQKPEIPVNAITKSIDETISSIINMRVPIKRILGFK